ncbi:MAG TPA: multiheme c-type cytochrome [Gemmataceae bacterium]|nr:multiheme c-type cytochrome [Gemmataceae bacterium]
MSRTRCLALFSFLAVLAGLAAVALHFGRGRGPDASSPSAREGPGDLLGIVRDGGPIAGACVRFKGTSLSTVTDAGGSFRLPQRSGMAGRVTAAKVGYFIAGTADDEAPLSLTLTRLPDKDNEEYRWVSSAPGAGRHNCGNCHEEIYREWSASAHSRSATGKQFRNLYDGSDWDGKPDAGWSLLRDNPNGSGVCNSCHVPTMPFDGSAYLDLRNAKGVAAEGVHCDYCHKVQEVGDGQLGVSHGRFNLHLLRPAEGQLFFGPLDDVDRGDDSFAPLYRDSRYCASCHEGTVFGVAVYTTYSEWQASPAGRAGKQCQTCHMAPTGRMRNIAPGHGGIERDALTLANHRFFAGGPAEMLRAAVSLSGEARRDGGTVRAEVEVRADGAGHRLPTGYIDRHLILVAEAVAADGRPLPLRDGPVLSSVAGKGLAGRPGKLYAKLLRDFDGHSPAPFWKADPEAADTRLTPGQPDRLTFVFPGETTGLRLRLLYRRFWQQVADEKRWPDKEIVVAERELIVPP